MPVNPLPQADFQTIVSKRIRHFMDTMNAKQVEYATNKNRMHNFDLAAQLIPSNDPVHAGWMMMIKHLISIHDIVFGDGKVSDETLNEKFSDMHVYLFLLEAMIVRRRDDTAGKEALKKMAEELKKKMEARNHERKDPDNHVPPWERMRRTFESGHDPEMQMAHKTKRDEPADRRGDRRVGMRDRVDTHPPGGERQEHERLRRGDGELQERSSEERPSPRQRSFSFVED